MTPNVAVVGCGYWGKNLVRNFAELGALRAVCDVDPSKVSSLPLDRFPEVKRVSSWSDLLGDDRITALAVATPAASHFALVRQALLAGKDVFVEKPLALSAAEGRELLELAQQHHRILMVGHLLRYHPAIARLKSLISEGTLGKIQYIYSNRLNLGRFRVEENILWSFAPHDLSVILYLLDEMPTTVAAHGSSYLTPGVPDVTISTLSFQSGVTGHIFVSWLHPYKEQKLVVVGDRRMAVFNDLESSRKLVLHHDIIEWKDRMPVLTSVDSEVVPIASAEPLRLECEHFLESLATRRKPETDAAEGLRVLQCLEASQYSLDRRGTPVKLPRLTAGRYFVHDTAVVDQPCEIGDGTKIWHFSHIMNNVRIGKHCNIGQNVFIGSAVVTGDNVKIQNNVSLYDGVVLEDDVFCGPSAVFTNVLNPRSHVSRKHAFRQTLVKKGASLGANCTIICGHTIGNYAFVGAGAVVTHDVPDYALMLGAPARLAGWMCQCGVRLPFRTGGRQIEESAKCPDCGVSYTKKGDEVRPVTTSPDQMP
jgi:UDP-2-acetamido-3-amino-2,3-dideoxy-glucuronate N-acetyltransferase